MDDILIVGAGIGGLTLALELHQRGIACRVFESAPEIKTVGVGINLLPHATRVLSDLGLQEALAKVAVETAEAAFFNRFGQLIYREPLGRRAGYRWPQFSIHRGDLQAVLLDAVRSRLGQDRFHLGFHCEGFDQTENQVSLQFKNQTSATGAGASRVHNDACRRGSSRIGVPRSDTLPRPPPSPAGGRSRVHCVRPAVHRSSSQWMA